LDLLALELEQTLVDVSGVALGARDRHILTFANALRRIAAPDDGRYTQLARNDGRVTGTAATVRHDRGSALHDGLPVRIGHIGDQYIARLHASHFGNVPDHPRGTCADALANAAAAGQYLGARFQREALDRASRAALHRLRASLQDEDLACRAILSPLDV